MEFSRETPLTIADAVSFALIDPQWHQLQVGDNVIELGGNRSRNDMVDAKDVPYVRSFPYGGGVTPTHSINILRGSGSKFFRDVEISKDGGSGQIAFCRASPADFPDGFVGDVFRGFASGPGSCENCRDLLDSWVRPPFPQRSKFVWIDQTGNLFRLRHLGARVMVLCSAWRRSR